MHSRSAGWGRGAYRNLTVNIPSKRRYCQRNLKFRGNPGRLLPGILLPSNLNFRKFPGRGAACDLTQYPDMGIPLQKILLPWFLKWQNLQVGLQPGIWLNSYKGGLLGNFKLSGIQGRALPGILLLWILNLQNFQFGFCQGSTELPEKGTGWDLTKFPWRYSRVIWNFQTL